MHERGEWHQDATFLSWWVRTVYCIPLWPGGLPGQTQGQTPHIRYNHSSVPDVSGHKYLYALLSLYVVRPATETDWSSLADCRKASSLATFPIRVNTQIIWAPVTRHSCGFWVTMYGHDNCNKWVFSNKTIVSQSSPYKGFSVIDLQHILDDGIGWEIEARATQQTRVGQVKLFTSIGY